IPRAGETTADDAWVAGAVDDVVDAARLEAAVERDHAGLAFVHEPPLRSRDDLAFRGRLVADGHHAFRALRIDGRVGLMIAIRDRRGGRLLVEDEVAAHESGDA